MVTEENKQFLVEEAKRIDSLTEEQFQSEFIPFLQMMIKRFPLTYFSILKGKKYARVKDEILKRVLFLEKYEKKFGVKFQFATRVYYAVNQKTDIERCQTCGDPYLRDISAANPDKWFHCDTYCAQQDKDVQKQIRQTKETNHTTTRDLLGRTVERNRKLYGCDWYFQTKEFEEKKLSTWNSNGYDHPMHSEEIKNKIGDWYEETYGEGIRCGFQVPEIQDKVKATNQKNLSADYPMQSKEFRQNVMHPKSTDTKLRSFYREVVLNYEEVEPLFSEEDYVNNRDVMYKFKWRCKKCGNVFEVRMFKDPEPRCLVCHPHIFTVGESNLEKEIRAFIQSIPSDYEVLGGTEENWNILTLSRQQLDVICKSKKTGKVEIAFEIDGIYWHQVSKKPKNYHLNKTRACERLGIKLVHIWEDEWYQKQEQVKDFITRVLQGRVEIDCSQDIIKLDRSQLNKCFKLEGYELIEETTPMILRRGNEKDMFDVQDCGMLVYKRIGDGKR